jgi:predicted N-acetyltransferase YhbS
VGRNLIEASLAAARAAGHQIVLLVGDLAYYERVGFARVRPGSLDMPGPVDPSRVLVLALAEGALEGLTGAVRT